MSTLWTIPVVAGLLSGCWLLARIPRPRTTRPHSPCSIIIPARNEGHTLPTLLESLRPQLGARDQVIVVDDDSNDDTADVASRGGATVLRAGPMPDGWSGKTWACAAGAGVATARTLVFLDADVTVEPGGLDSVLANYEDGLLSVQPYHLTVRPYERLSLFFNLASMMGTNAFTPLGSRARSIGAFGPCLVTTREDYHAVGGHAAVAGSVLDDVDLARRYSLEGRRVRCLAGRGSLSFRMYPSGVRQLIEGWSKNLSGGAIRTPRVTMLLVIVWIALCIQAPWLGWPGYAAVVAQLAWMARRVGRFGLVVLLTYPIALLVFLAIFVRSAYLLLVRKEVVWKGRTLNPDA